jgi:hypothetical protein
MAWVILLSDYLAGPWLIILEAGPEGGGDASVPSLRRGSLTPPTIGAIIVVFNFGTSTVFPPSCVSQGLGRQRPGVWDSSLLWVSWHRCPPRCLRRCIHVASPSRKLTSALEESKAWAKAVTTRLLGSGCGSTTMLEQLVQRLTYSV